MKNIMKLFLLSMFLFVIKSYAGFTVNNGGDTVECFKDRTSPYVGYFNLDYLTNKIYNNKYASDFESTVKSSDTFDVQIKRIIGLTAKKFPTFSRSLFAFESQFFLNDFNAPYSWKTAPYGLVEVNDENLKLIVPGNCLRNSPKGPFIQTIVRSQMPEQIEFTYYTSVFNLLSPLQKSFLLFHEWLWNFTDDPEIVRNANSILHSKDWSEETLSFKMGELLLAGLDFKNLGKKVENPEIYVQEDVMLSNDWDIHNQQINGIPYYALSKCSKDNFCRYRIINKTNKRLFGLQETNKELNLTDFLISPQNKGTLFYEPYSQEARQFICFFLLEDGAPYPKECLTDKVMTLKPQYIVRFF